jgi:hypothetical protein
MRFYYDDIRKAVQNGLREEQGQALNDAGSVPRADFDRLSQELADLLEEMGWSPSASDNREVDEDDSDVFAAC